ncbi:MAG: C40 family peptidase [Verrucomicrobiales bacterium]|nr:C40 family peptidase [Verrucomicrobiales bacterium]
MKNLQSLRILIPLCALAMMGGVSCTTTDFASSTGGSSSSVVRHAKSWHGKHYKPGTSRQCANWVTHVVSKAGKKPPPGSSASRSWVNWGKSIPRSQIQPGDVLVFSGTYKSGISHVGIALGGGQFIHRSTNSAPVKVSTLNNYRIASVRRG